MSLATRCPACGTVFRVVRDQLKVSEGWVRCGRCSEVFNASERLFELEQGLPAGGVVAAAPTTAPRADRPATARVGSALAPASQPELPLSPTPGTAIEHNAESAPEPVAATEEREGFGVGNAAAGSPADLVAAPPEPVHADVLDMRAEPTPGFVLRAERAERWRQPRWRAGLALLSLLLALTLAAQVTLHYRDEVAAAWPAARPALSAACAWLGCRIEPPRHIDSLAVDSSGLVRVEGSELYRLSLVVRNHASMPVHMPAVDLTLTDAQGQTTARRVLLAAELGQRDDSVPAQAEATLHGVLEVDGPRIAGYTIDLFYP